MYKFSDQSKENANLYTETVNEKRAQNSEQKIASVVGKKSPLTVSLLEQILTSWRRRGGNRDSS